MDLCLWLVLYCVVSFVLGVFVGHCIAAGGK